MPLAPGTHLGPYEIAEPLGAGGMGEVYRARDTRLERTVAIKILPAQFSSDAVRKQRFEREAKTISSLNHPHICVLHDVGSQDGIDYLVMECVEGESLAKRLGKGPLPLEQVLKYGAQIADALDKAHRSGVVHRDLKPGNIMLTPTGAKLLDFGLAKPLAPVTSVDTWTAAVRQSSPITEQGAIVGTFQYMSPEQIEGKELDGRSDIFSLGAVLYEMLTGQRAFEGKSQLSVASAVLEKEPAPISSIKPLTPLSLEHTVRRCLAKNPDERWQTARDLALELQWIAESGSQAGAPTTAARPGRNRDLFGWAASTLLLCALAALGIAYWKRTVPTSTVVRSAIPPPPDSQFYAMNIDAGGPAISPDGKFVVAAVKDSKGKTLLWLHAFEDAGEGKALPGTDDGGHPFWSPDSRAIGFYAGGKLKRISVEGNSLQPLCDASRGRGGTWSAEGTILFTPTPSSGLFQIPANGGTPKQVTELNANRWENSHRWPVFLPDGRHFLFFVRSFQPDISGIYVGSLDSRESHSVAKTAFGAVFSARGYLLYLRGETLVAQAFDERRLALTGEPLPLVDRVFLNPGTSSGLLSVSNGGVLVYYPAGKGGGPLEVAWFDRNGKIGASLERGYLYGPALSPDGARALIPKVGEDGLTSDLWNIDLVRGTRTRVTSGPGFKTVAVWAPDGQSLFFSSYAKDQPHIYRTKSDGTGPTETVLESRGVEETPWSVCRDGRYVAYNRSTIEEYPRYSIWILPLTGERKPFPLVQSQFSNAAPVFSSDCQWVAYSSNESGRREVYVTHFPDAARRYQVSTEGGAVPQWRGDDKELFYFSPEQSSMTSVTVQKRGAEISLGNPRVLFPIPNVTILGSMFGVSSDGQRFLVSGVYPLAGNAPLTLVMNWDADLNKK